MKKPDNGLIRSIIERIQRLEEEIKSINDDKSDIYAEAKGCGFDVKALKAAISYLRKDRSKADEHDAIVAAYLLAFEVGTGSATRVRPHDASATAERSA
jgi:uncharacterized protein (UPF0335 family)